MLRDGRNACESRPMTGSQRQDLVRLMIGRDEQIPDWAPRDHGATPSRCWNCAASRPRSATKAIDLTVRKGEIVGLYGLVGAGRTELAKCILGLYPLTAGEIALRASPSASPIVADAIHRCGIGYISEDRKQEGLILAHTVLENAGITVWRKLAGRLGCLRDEAVRAHVSPVIAKLEVRTPSLAQIVGNLSGGNQQKISVAKWLAAGVRILIVDEPTVGIDIKTKAYIHELLRQLADEGTAILLITSDMPEMITLADRIVVMDDYRIKGEIVNDRDYGPMSEKIMRLIHDRDAA